MNRRRRYLANQSFVALGLAQLIGIISMSYPALLPVYLCCMIIGGVVIFRDYRTLPDGSTLAAKLELVSNTELDEILKLQVEVLRNDRFGQGTLKVSAPSVRGLAFETDAVMFSGERPNSIASLQARAVELGYFELKKLSFIAYSKLGYWLQTFELDIPPLSFRVSPPLKPVTEQVFQEMARNQRLLYQGSRQVLRGQAADQFYSVRKYQFPDSVRHIDQKKSAKYQQLMTRTYESIYNHHLVIALDVGRSLCGTVGESRSHDYYLSVCLALAKHALLSHDLVSFVGFSDRLHVRINATRNYASFSPLLRGEEILKPREVESNYEILARVLPEIAAQRSIVVLLSDTSKPSVQAGILKSLLPISQKHLTLVLGLVDESRDLKAHIAGFNPENVSTKDFAQMFYSYWLDEQAALFAAKVSRLGAGAFSLPQNCWMSASVKVYDLLRSSMRA